MQKSLLSALFSSAFTATAILSLGFKEPEKPTNLTQQQLNEQSVLALNWMQQSGEYIALTHQAFNNAKMLFDYARFRKISNLAFIVDIDETVLDNSAYQAGLVDTNNRFNSGSWNQWVATKKARAIPGAIEFVNYVNARDGKVFFITDRVKSSQKDGSKNDLEIATIENLKSLGFTGVNPKTVILKGEFTRTIAGKIDTSKEWRREAVINGQADGKKYNWVSLMVTISMILMIKLDKQIKNAEPTFRKTNTVMARSILLETYLRICLYYPTQSIYGAWELGLYNPQAVGKKQLNELTPAEISQQRKQALNRWLPDVSSDR